MAIKIIKNQGLSFVFAQKNAAHCISGQNKWLEVERLQRSLVAGITRGDSRENWTKWWEYGVPEYHSGWWTEEEGKTENGKVKTERWEEPLSRYATAPL